MLYEFNLSSGLAIRTLQDNTVLVKDVRPGGAIAKDGFIKVQNRSQIAQSPCPELVL